MSFGFSAGDFVLLVQIAHTTFRNCQKAGEEYIEIACEVRCLHSVLRTLRTEAQKPDSKLFRQDPASTAQLIATIDGCNNVLDGLDYILAKYEGLKSDGQASASKKLWQRFRFGSKTEELAVIRGKLQTHTSTLSVLLDTVQIQAADRVEAKIDGGFADMAGQFERMRKEIYKIASQKRAEERRGATVSSLSLSTCAGDEKVVWQDFRRELVKKGFRSQSLEKHRAILQAYMLKLDQSGLLDQDHISSSYSANGSPWWARRMYMETINSLADLDVTENPPSYEATALPGISEQRCKKDENELGVEESLEQRETSPIPSPSTDYVARPLRNIKPEEKEKVFSSTHIEIVEETASISSLDSNSELGDENKKPELRTGLKDEDSAPIPSKSKADIKDRSGQNMSGDLSSPKNLTAEWYQRKNPKQIQEIPRAYVRDEDEERSLYELDVEDRLHQVPCHNPSIETDQLEVNLPVLMEAEKINRDADYETRKDAIRQRGHSPNTEAQRAVPINITAQNTTIPTPVSPTTAAANLIYDANGIDESTGRNNNMIRNAHQEPERTREASGDLQRLREMVKDAERVGASDKDARTLKELMEEIERIQETGTQQDLNFQHHLISAATILSTEISTKRRAEREVARRYEESRHERSRRSPSPLLSETDQKVHYSRAPIEIIEEWSIPIEKTKTPLKGILKKPTERFPEEPNPIREGVARLKDANSKNHGVPSGARWTKISRQLVNPEALEARGERFEVLPDSVIVLRALSKTDIQEYAELTKRIRAARN